MNDKLQNTNTMLNNTTNTNMLSNTKNNKRTLTCEQRTKQLTKLTVFIIITITVLIIMPTNSIAASLFDANTKMSSYDTTITILEANHPNTILSNNEQIVLQQLADSGKSDGQHTRRRRLRKRHNVNMRLSELAQNSKSVEKSPLEWVNTCGGYEVVPHDDHAKRIGSSRKQVRKQLIYLKKSLRYENSTQLNSLQKIIIDDMHSWRLYRKKYRFLPSLNRASKIELHNWHRHMQKFVASFADLGVKQYRWDQEKRQHTTELTRELNSLLLSAKRVLCEVEIAFNATHPHAKLPIITREDMQRKLKFYSNDDKRVAERGVDPIDLKYAKHRYSRYVQNMFHILRKHLRTMKAVADKMSSKSTTSSWENSGQNNGFTEQRDDSGTVLPIDIKSSAQASSDASNEVTA